MQCRVRFAGRRTGFWLRPSVVTKTRNVRISAHGEGAANACCRWDAPWQFRCVALPPQPARSTCSAARIRVVGDGQGMAQVPAFLTGKYWSEGRLLRCLARQALVNRGHCRCSESASSPRAHPADGGDRWRDCFPLGNTVGPLPSLPTSCSSTYRGVTPQAPERYVFPGSDSAQRANIELHEQRTS